MDFSSLMARMKDMDFICFLARNRLLDLIKAMARTSSHWISETGWLANVFWVSSQHIGSLRLLLDVIPGIVLVIVPEVLHGVDRACRQLLDLAPDGPEMR